MGFGTSYIAEAPEKDAVAVIRRACEGGVNYFSLATEESKTFPYFGTALFRFIASTGCPIRMSIVKMTLSIIR